jgi:hypothetical protein
MADAYDMDKPGAVLEMSQLLKFYGKFGFVPIQETPCVLLARQP